MEQWNASCRTATGGRVDKGLGPWSAGVQGFYRALSSCLFSLVKMQGPSLIWGDGGGVERELNFSPVNLQVVHPSLQWTPTVLESQECESWMHIRYLPQTLQLAPLKSPWCEREAMAAVKPSGFLRALWIWWDLISFTWYMPCGHSILWVASLRGLQLCSLHLAF